MAGKKGVPLSARDLAVLVAALDEIATIDLQSRYPDWGRVHELEAVITRLTPHYHLRWLAHRALEAGK